MCTRFAQFSLDISDTLEEGYNLEIVHWLDKDNHEAKWNVDYETVIPVLVQGLPGSGTSANDWVLCPMKWGMRRKRIGGDRGEYLNFFTSKAETATDPSKIWQAVRQVRRCVVPCNGYVELDGNSR